MPINSPDIPLPEKKKVAEKYTTNTITVALINDQNGTLDISSDSQTIFGSEVGYTTYARVTLAAADITLTEDTVAGTVTVAYPTAVFGFGGLDANANEVATFTHICFIYDNNGTDEVFYIAPVGIINRVQGNNSFEYNLTIARRPVDIA